MSTYYNPYISWETYSDYHIRQDVLSAWLRWKFNDNQIQVHVSVAPIRAVHQQLPPLNMDFDPHDRLLDVCRNYLTYPNTLLKRLPKNILDRYQAYLARNEADLFDEYRARILLWEAWSGENNLANVGDNSFIESEHSRAPLNCSAPMLKLVLTFHQVDPSFLDYIFTFGDQEEPQDACLSQFQSHDALAIHERLPFIPQLGRSGKEIRHSFLLRSVERVPEATSWPWSVRQLAAYHSFDVGNGRTIWITAKGNDLMQRRIMDDTADLPALRASAGRDVAASFEAALGTLLIYFAWCEENWRWFVRDIEDHIRQELRKAKTVPIDEKPYFTNVPQKMNTGLTTSSKSSHNPWNYPEKIPEKRDIFSSFRRLSRPSWHTPSGFDVPPPPPPPPPGHGQPAGQARREMPDDTLVLKIFSYKDLQKLISLGERLEESLLIINLNLRVLQNACEYYQRLADSEDIGKEIKQRFVKSIAQFQVKTRGIIENLETRQMQLLSLRKRLEEGKALFESLLQYRGLEVGRIFAEHGHKSALVMQNIAYRTEQETVTVRVITVITLLFLPATFLSSFFQSGIIDWDDAASIGFRADAFRLFMAICVPFTAAALIGWLVTNKWGDLRSRRKSLEDTTATMQALLTQQQKDPPV
ncbi:hypothetical protein B0T26DRAFT_646130 [Lasiosphaeria miniovina]|uniref:CorA-like transporter domain-containing protein n=1 Tax=Lasiosphaeria miniovina TaxID=1954250 RepID=A0AA40DUW8_9PEZI|nr:uncharacterized protein B0T26DRAFT_646130 [Lasiosphaeria miniovina]KAK0717304.1 hypothetical protein B0T26DRAFT_646130 [Lasiosphaeria miniovina]